MIYKKSKSKGFTLIELLAVIAIIGLLSAIVLISVKSARDKAEEKKNMQFSASIYHSLGAYAIGIWHFDGNLDDSSGNGNNGEWAIADDGKTYASGKTTKLRENWLIPVAEASEDPDKGFATGITNKAIDFMDSESMGVLIPSSSKLINKSGAITVEFWTKVSSTYNGNLITNEGYYTYLYLCTISSANLTCEMSDNVDNYISFSAARPSANKWFHIALTYDGKGGNPQMYLNNKEINRTGSLETEISNEGDIMLGDGGDLFMDELRIYDSYISLSEVQNHYADGLMRIGLAEYYGRINKN